MSAAITLDDLTVSYRRHPALHHASGAFVQGSLTAIVGPNGAGKSTLLKSLLGMVRLDTGSVTIAAQRKRIAYLPQQSDIERSFPITVRDCVLLGHWQHSGLFAGLSHELVTQADTALRQVGLDGFGARTIAALSAGQFQRVLFARILLQDADLILLDEPFNAIDARTTSALLEIVHHWHAEGRTVIAVLHDHQQVRQHFPQCLLLAREIIAWGDTASVLGERNLQRAEEMTEDHDEHAPVCVIDHPAHHETAAKRNLAA
ncbi:MAG: metal ABC transporter ATP-binding protein [Janthinobacterium lividum]